MATGLRLKPSQRLRWALARRRMRRHRTSTVSFGPVALWSIEPEDPDEGSAGVREPRRPKPDLPTLAAEAQE
jgi:hypothetical protein